MPESQEIPASSSEISPQAIEYVERVLSLEMPIAVSEQDKRTIIKTPYQPNKYKVGFKPIQRFIEKTNQVLFKLGIISQRTQGLQDAGSVLVGSATASSVDIYGPIYQEMEQVWGKYQELFDSNKKQESVQTIYEETLKDAQEIRQYMRGYMGIDEKTQIVLATTGTHSFRVLRALLDGDNVVVISSGEAGSDAANAFKGFAFAEYNLRGEEVEAKIIGQIETEIKTKGIDHLVEQYPKDEYLQSLHQRLEEVQSDPAAKNLKNKLEEAMTQRLIELGKLQGLTEAEYPEIPLRNQAALPHPDTQEWYLAVLKQSLADAQENELSDITAIINITFPGKGGNQSLELYDFSRNLTTLALAINSGETVEDRRKNIRKLYENNSAVQEIVRKLGGMEQVVKMSRLVTVADAAQQRVIEQYEDKDLVAEGICLATNISFSKRDQFFNFSAALAVDPWIIEQGQKYGLTAEYAADFVGTGHFEAGTQLKVDGQLIDINEYAKNQGNIDMALMTRIKGGLPTLKEYHQTPLEQRQQIVKKIERFVAPLINAWGWAKEDLRSKKGTFARQWSLVIDEYSNKGTPSVFTLILKDRRPQEPVSFKKLRALLMDNNLPLPPELEENPDEWPDWMPEDLDFIQAALQSYVELPNPFTELIQIGRTRKSFGPQAEQKKHPPAMRLAIGVLNELAWKKNPESVKLGIRLALAKIAFIIEYWEFYSKHEPQQPN